jgi:hypothetical protein
VGVQGRGVRARREMQQVRLVVAEAGTIDLVAAANPTGEDTEGRQRVVVAQNAGEVPMAFATRVIRRILALEREERAISRTTRLLGSHLDAEVTAARRLVARALITHTVTVGAELTTEASGGRSRSEDTGG